MPASEPRVFAYVSYRDVLGAIRWLETIGFETVLRQEESGRVIHSELRSGDSVIMVASYDEECQTPCLMGHSTGRELYILTEHVDALFERAAAAGGHPVLPPESTDWGSRRARVLDPEGNEWTFGSYEPGHERV